MQGYGHESTLLATPGVWWAKYDRLLSTMLDENEVLRPTRRRMRSKLRPRHPIQISAAVEDDEATCVVYAIC